MAKSTMGQEIEFTSQEYHSYINKVDSYLKVLRCKLDDYEIGLRERRYNLRLEDSIIHGINDLKDLQRKYFSYRADDLVKIENLYVKFNEDFFGIDEPLLDDYLEERLDLN